MTPVRSIHQIEVTTKCNLACSYCVHGNMPRPKVDMDASTFSKALDLVRYFRAMGTQPELSLTGIGEPLLRPDFVRMLAGARGAMQDGTVLFATNGLLLDSDMAKEIAPYRPDVYVSLHAPDRAMAAVEACKGAGIRVVTNNAFKDSSLDWAGQVEWPVSAPPSECQYLRQGWGVVLVDGRMVNCCMDGAEPKKVIGTIWDDPTTLFNAPFSLCGDCSLIVPEEVA